MANDIIKRGFYRNNKTQKVYSITDFGKVKIGDVWQEAVIYVDNSVDTWELYIRTVDNFSDKFTYAPDIN